VKRILFILIVSFFLSLKAQASPVISSQEVDFDSPEGWGMSYMSSASLNLTDSFPKPLELGELVISAELSTIPELNREQQKIGFGGFKYEDLNKSPLFGRGKIKVGFYRDWILEFSYTPSLEIKGAKPKNLYGLAMSKQIFKNDSVNLGLRLYALSGSAIADVTCSEAVVNQPLYSPGNPSGCIATSKDKIDLSHRGFELVLAQPQTDAKFKPWASIATTRIDPSVRIDAQLELTREIAFVETKGTLQTLNFGVNYQLSEDLMLHLGTSYTPLDVKRPNSVGGDDNFWNFKLGLSLKSDNLF